MEAGISTELLFWELELASETNGKATAAWQADRLSPKELITYILNHHHSYVNQMIPVIEAYINKTAAHHASEHPELLVIKNLFAELKAELEQHMQKEEMVLFPYIINLENAHLSGQAKGTVKQEWVSRPIRMMESEHDRAGNIMKEIRRLSSDYTPPVTACQTYSSTYRELLEFEKDLHEHIHLENNILFPESENLELKLLELSNA